MISIIYADDKVGLLRLGKQILEQNDEFSVDTCITIQESLEKIIHHTYDVIISGFSKPGIDGIALLRAVRERSSIPFIFLKSPDNREDLLEIFRSNADIFPWKEGDEESLFLILALKIRQLVQRNQPEISVSGLKSEVETLRHRGAMLRILNEIISEVNNAQTISDLLEKVLDKSIRLLNFDAGGIYFVDTDSRTAHIVHSQNLPSGFIAEVDDVSIDKEPYKTMFVRNQPLFIENYARVSPERSQKYGLCSIATLPLMAEGKAIGVLNIASFRRYLISDEEKETLISISRELGSAIGRLFAEEEKIKGAQNIRTLFQSIDDIIFVINLKGDIVAMNTAAEERLSYSKQELIGRSILTILDPEKREEALKFYDKLIDGTGKDNSIPIISKNGARIEVDTKITRGKWDDQDVLIGVSRDVTERRQFEEALQKSERQLNEAQHLAKTGSWELDIPANFLTWSEVIFEIFEIDPLQFGASYEAFLNAIHPDDQKAVDDAYSDSLQEKTPYQIEHRLLMPDGRIKYVQERCETKYDDSGKPLSSLGTVQDITELKETEKALRLSQEKYSKLFLSSPDAIIISDLDSGRIIEVNEAFSLNMEYTPDELNGKNTIELGIWGTKEERDKLISLIKKQGRVRGFETITHAKSGKRYFVSISAETIAIEGNRFLISTIRDITKRKQHEIALKESEEKYRNVVEQARDGIVIVQDLNLVFSNEAFARMTGYTIKDLTGLDFRTLFPPDKQEKIAEVIQNRLAGESLPGMYETTLLRSNNSEIPVEAIGAFITYHGAPADLIIIRDISERKRLEISLLEALQKLKILTGITRHDIINDLNIITVSLDLVLGMDMSPQQQEYITNALTAGETLKNTIEFTREYEDFGSLSSRWVHLASIVDAARSDVYLGEITVEISISLDIEIFADPIIQKVFSTLFDNSIRHGTTISAIRVKAQKQKKNLVIVYTDDGIGIEEKDKENIFKHGFGKNTGVGLYLVRELLSITGLKISETGKPGEGVRFEIVVPNGTFRFQKH
ncbi:PAS domain S-box protein [Methanospirillum stamsii]|uniref:histidine kinase n=1 Tax=Methanospirillum stamsii TaxID=1277351 RepID=A0A2V2MYA5_9EURY|nr:PAS domain S-box protein [Methanospirillum stamsii]PWR73114.1 hypothetical protein DLD82_11070 [Methanospirillum stamsii]